MDFFNKQFEETLRGTSSQTEARLGVYLPFIEALRDIYPDGSVTDLGCGRGEVLELLRDHGVSAEGVDINPEMEEMAKELGLDVHTKDAVDFLQGLPDASRICISSIHMVEHIEFDGLQRLVREAHRVLLPGGLLILETPNPENLVVGTCDFYADPTHRRPIPPELLRLVSEYTEFKRTKILRLQESRLPNNTISLRDVLSGVSPDYAIVAQKDAPAEILDATELLFARDSGKTLSQLTEEYDAAIQTQLEKLRSNLSVEKERSTTFQEEQRGIAKTITAYAQQLSAKLTAQTDHIESCEQRIHQLETELSAAKEEQGQVTLRERQEVSERIEEMRNRMVTSQQMEQVQELLGEVEQKATSAEAKIEELSQEQFEAEQRLSEELREKLSDSQREILQSWREAKKREEAYQQRLEVMESTVNYLKAKVLDLESRQQELCSTDSLEELGGRIQGLESHANTLGKVLNNVIWQLDEQVIPPRTLQPAPDMLTPENGNDLLAQLMARQDSNFIETAYNTILLRASDPKGMQHYLSMLRQGESKVEILGRLRFSPEGRRQKVRIPKLGRSFLFQRIYRIPLLGGLLQALSAGLRSHYLEQNQRKLEASLFRFFESDTRKAPFYPSIEGLSTLVLTSIPLREASRASKSTTEDIVSSDFWDNLQQEDPKVRKIYFEICEEVAKIKEKK